MSVIAGRKSPELIEYLHRRRSVKADDLVSPGPDAEQLEAILTAAARVPDHGKMCPWYFMVFEGDARAQAGVLITEVFADENPDERDDKKQRELNRFLRAPLVIGVIARIRPGKNPIWEQVLSSGAACMNAVLAANALGFGAQWLTEWYAYHPRVREGLGLDARDHVAGFIHIGTPANAPEERDRPDLFHITTRWTPGQPINKGDVFDRDKFDFPHSGFDFSKLG